MEKHKPHRCETCGKRYKNLNGLKYHKNHSPQCDHETSHAFPQGQSHQKSAQL
jgi:transcription factor SFP1